MKICVITPNYPHSLMPEQGVFVANLTNEWYESGVDISVVAPVSSIFLARNFIGQMLSNIERAQIIADFSVSRPLYHHVSAKQICGFDLRKVSNRNFISAARKAIRSKKKVEVYYGKFLETGAAAAIACAEDSGAIAIADVGESLSFRSLPRPRLDFIRTLVPRFTGLICVSPRLKDELIWLGANPTKVLMLPNEADQKRFQHGDKDLSRKKLELPLAPCRIVIFVGHFNERKGPDRVLAALEKLEPDIKGVFLGRGALKPSGPRVLHAGPVPNDLVPTWLNASDVFVLPTRAEGWCNAIEEAAACGLPLVVSDIAEVRDQIQGRTAVFVRPDNIDEISEGIRLVLESDGKSPREVAGRVNTQGRGERILDWINQLI